MRHSENFIVQLENDFSFLGDEYADLFAKSSATAFQEPVWLNLFYGMIMGEYRSPAIVTIRRRETNELCLLLPLLKTRHGGVPCIEPADLGISDYNSAIVRTDCETEILGQKSLRRKLLKTLGSYQLILFRKVRADDEFMMSLFGKVRIGMMDSSAYDVPFWAPYEDWQQRTLSKNFRKDLRRSRRKLEAFGEVDFEVLEDPDAIRMALETMRDMRALRYEDDLFQIDEYFNFYLKVAIEGAKAGIAQTAIVKAGEDIAAVEFGLICGNCYHFILGGVDLDNYGKCSPGFVVMDAVMKHRAESGDVRLDFTIGDEAYKQRFGTRKKELVHIARIEGSLGFLVYWTYVNGGAIKEVAKKVDELSQKNVALRKISSLVGLKRAS